MRRKSLSSRITGLPFFIISLYELPGHLGNLQTWYEWLAMLEILNKISWPLFLIGIALFFAPEIRETWKNLAFKSFLCVLSETSFEQFDTPIRKAIYHLIETTPHSYTWSGMAERQAFTKLHEAMCKGRLPVIGKEGDFMMPRRISRWECRRLKPMEVAVNATDAAPDGVRFSLVQIKTDEGNEKLELELCDLRVRSFDLYDLWPKV